MGSFKQLFNNSYVWRLSSVSSVCVGGVEENKQSNGSDEEVSCKTKPTIAKIFNYGVFRPFWMKFTMGG